MERIQKIIAQAGVTSRRKAEELIRDGKVVVDGRIATLGESADPERAAIVVDGQELKKEKSVYLALHKPKGYITTTSDPYGRPHVLALVRVPQRVYPVGRLDSDTSGLLLLTNDGGFANKVMHPRYEIPKTYIATLDKKIAEKDIEKINSGVVLERRKITARARTLSGKRVEITVHTGLNKEVKRIFKKLGYWVRELSRSKIGSLKLDVKEGKYRHLHPSEVEKLVKKG